MLKQFNHLICFELSKYSACFEIMNEIKSSAVITVFEISPTPSGGILILTAQNSEQCVQFYKKQKEKHCSTILDSCLVENISVEILNAYLSQSKPVAISKLGFYETNSVSAAFGFIQDAASKGGQIVDFRVIRSIHNRCIIVLSGDLKNINCIQINQPTEQVISYFQILK